MSDPTACLVQGCSSGVRYPGVGLCNPHYQRWHRTGRAEPAPPPSLRELFEAKVDRNGPTPKHRPDLGPCWLWTGLLGDSGYGVFRRMRAHRWVYEQENGPVPPGLELDHFACDRRDCVRPTHVRPVTHLENMRRGAHALKTHCPQGHPYDEANTFLYAGRRNCKTCKAQRQRDYRAKMRARS